MCQNEMQQGTSAKTCRMLQLNSAKKNDKKNENSVEIAYLFCRESSEFPPGGSSGCLGLKRSWKGAVRARVQKSLHVQSAAATSTGSFRWANIDPKTTAGRSVMWVIIKLVIFPRDNTIIWVEGSIAPTGCIASSFIAIGLLPHHHQNYHSGNCTSQASSPTNSANSAQRWWWCFSPSSNIAKFGNTSQLLSAKLNIKNHSWSNITVVPFKSCITIAPAANRFSSPWNLPTSPLPTPQ